MRKLLRYLLFVFLGLLLAGLGVGWWLHQPLPEGRSGPEAEALADKMLLAVGDSSYQQLAEIRWSYPSGHHYSWKRPENVVIVRWDNVEVLLTPDTGEGEVRQAGELLTGEAAEEATQKAWKYFANDSFWLAAPFKIRDPGTERRLVSTDRGDALLVTYTSGGVTPGDSYLWYLDDSGRPVAWQLWVSILPIGGLEFTWEGWENHQGAWLSTRHDGPKEILITNLETR